MKPDIIILIIFFMIFTGCLSEKKIERKYYTIEIPSGQLPVNTDSIPLIKGVCEIDQVEVNEAYAKNQIVNKSESNEVSYYVYNQWAVRPSDAVKELLFRYLEAAMIFQTISAGYTKSIPEYRFWTSIDRLEVIEKNKSSSAEVSLEFRIINNSSGDVILSHKAKRTSTLEEMNLNLFAREVSKIIFEELNIFSTMIKENKHLFILSH